MPTPSRPSRASSVASVDTTASQSSAALLGATKAFVRAAPQQRTTSASDVRGNGALAAASTAGSGSGSKTPVSRSPRPPPASREPSVGRESVKEKAQMDMSKFPSLAPPQQARPPHSRSPSHQAAVLATSRAQPTASTSTTSEKPGRHPPGTGSKRPAVAPKPRRLSEHFKPSNGKSDKPTDTTPIAPTTSLVDLFERRLKETQDSPGKRPEPIVIKPSNELTLKSPKPVRSGITSMLQLELGSEKEDKRSQDIGPSSGERHDSIGQGKEGRPSSDDSFASASEDLNPRSPPSSPPRALPIRSVKTASPSPGHTLKVENEAKRRPQVSPSPLRQTASKPIEIKPPRRPSTAQSDTLSASSSKSLRSIPAQFNQAYPRRMTPLTTGDELANALVASSLASSRGPSPKRFDPPAAPYRKKNHHHHHHHGLSFSRTPSPKKGAMLHTLRKKDDSSSDSESDPHPYAKHRKKRLVRKHPNKHHEGDRKRWRDAVTERERKRYEGVWAANKGMHYSFTYEEIHFFERAPDHPRTKETKTAVQDQVSNLVARDIWLRSRLPPAVLETVWDLVDHDSVGRLHKEEFVVGMWLIDQRLKGRKLPTRVTETVWASVRGIQGIKIKK
ncbi:hypothetical protein M409DRAFT_67473 [Zasmidium cellare ATCC 36951]|uniref:EH domain-containing protein n=1 Tax=Zasmidium cellare ATCC 36951 TaxID=1080233 RepID=A0A6A6CDE9_ZASCE|nr:uncharacterized protein M409DRAFT_67473 [Zasmidium cellare ATCC 36951]KAF2165214.1 hypothetical protein M409DRAFT_67473 [Zasmidium cellare ATCC 36951]